MTEGRPDIRVTSFEAVDQEIRNRIEAFMARFRIGALLSQVLIWLIDRKNENTKTWAIPTEL